MGAKRTLALLSGVALTIGTSALAAPAGATGGGATVRPMMTIVTANGLRAELLAQWTLPGGSVASRWDVGGNVVVVAGAPGTSVAITGTSNSLGVSATPSAALAKASENPNRLAVEYAASGESVYWQAIAVGMAPAQAAQMTLSMGVPLPTGVSASGAITSSIAPRQTGHATPALGGVFNSSCDHASADGGSAQGNACIVQRVDSETSEGDIYVYDVVSGSAKENAAALSSLCQENVEDYYRYGNSYGDHSIVDNGPNGSIDVGNPTTKSWSVGIGGANYGQSEVVYPSQLNPALDDPWGSVGQYHAAWEVDWSGSEGSSTVPDNLEDIAHVWPHSSTVAGVYIFVSDNWFC